MTEFWVFYFFCSVPPLALVLCFYVKMGKKR